MSAAVQAETSIESTGPDLVELFWIPLGAGGHCVSLNGQVYESLMALRAHRGRKRLYHSALQVRHGGTRYVIEMAPAWHQPAPACGAVCEGPVGSRLLQRWCWFRYEVRCWPEGRIPDVEAAVGSPVLLGTDADAAVRLLSAVERVPRLTWGRDEIGAGEMWNSNSVVSWLLTVTCHDLSRVQPPPGGRAPGWQAGRLLAARETAEGFELPSARPTRPCP